MPIYERAGREILKRIQWNLIPDHIIDDVLTALGDWVPVVTSRPYGDEREPFEMREKLLTPDWVGKLERQVAQAEDQSKGGQVATTGTPPTPVIPGEVQGPKSVLLGDQVIPGKTRVRWERMVGSGRWATGTVSTFQRGPGSGSIHVIPDMGRDGIEFLVDLDRAYYAQGPRRLYYAEQGREGPQEAPGATEQAKPDQEPGAKVIRGAKPGIMAGDRMVAVHDSGSTYRGKVDRIAQDDRYLEIVVDPNPNDVRLIWFYAYRDGDEYVSRGGYVLFRDPVEGGKA
jgi:hypothetical protein